jgi:hypothetical protein
MGEENEQRRLRYGKEDLGGEAANRASDGVDEGVRLVQRTGNDDAIGGVSRRAGKGSSLRGTDDNAMPSSTE